MTTYGYARVSTLTQAEDGTSLDAQERKVRGAAMMRGEEIAEVFSDPGVSGSIALGKRPGGRRLMLAVRAGDTIIVAKMDRIFRSAADALATAQVFQEAGIKLILADLGPDPVTENGTAKLFFTMLAALAEFERTRIAERMSEGRKGKKATGGHVGGLAPYGYRTVGEGRDAKLDIQPEEQEAIKTARDLREAGASLRDIGKALSAKGLVTRNGKAWAPQQVSNLIDAGR